MKSFICFLALIMTILVLGCGHDGDDGDAYLRITWLYDPLYYTDNNGYIPSIVVNNRYYRCSAGRYYFEYYAWDDSYWYGYYTLTINRGEDGKFLSNGDDGADKYFTLQCYSIGPSFYDFKPLIAGQKPLVDNLYDIELKAGASAGAALASISVEKKKTNTEYRELGPIQKQTLVRGRYTLELVYQKGVR